MQLEPNILFHNRYRLIEMKGRGSFGEVWLAHDERLDMDVAIKVYIALDDRGVAEFKSEYKTTFGLNHPNLLHANHFDQCESRPYLVMPYCPDAVTNYIGNIDEPTVWRFIRDVAAGLEYLHSMGIIHHDIKPDNVLIDTEGNFLITDFGISKKIRSTLRRNSARQGEANDIGGGSISYMGPEMFGPRPDSVNATDIWALGATLYELCEGDLPFFGQGGGMQLNGAQVPELNGNYSNDLKQTVQACLAKEPWDRPTAKELAEQAQAVIDGHPYRGTPEPKIEPQETQGNFYGSGDHPEETPVAPRKKRKTWLWVLLALLLVGGGFAAWLLASVAAWWLTLSGNKPDPGKEYFDYCQQHPTIENYRSYVRQYPQGEYIDLAYNWIDNWVKDSLNTAQELDNRELVSAPEDKNLSKTPSASDGITQELTIAENAGNVVSSQASEGITQELTIAENTIIYTTPPDVVSYSCFTYFFSAGSYALSNKPINKVTTDGLRRLDMNEISGFRLVAYMAVDEMDHGEAFAENRANAVRQEILKMLKKDMISKSFDFQIQTVGPDWEFIMNAITTSGNEDKEAVLSNLRSSSNKEDTFNQMCMIYPFLEREIIPYCRKVDVYVY